MKQPDEKTMIFLGATLILFMLFLLQGNRVENGVVIDKKYQKAHSELEMTPSAGGAMRLQLVHHNDEWTLILKDDDNTGRCWVSEVEWGKVEVGDWVNCSDLKRTRTLK